MSRNCFAPGCDTGYRKAIARNKALGRKNPSMFSAPKEIEILEKWRRAIPRKDKVFAAPSKLCELHFEEECIQRSKEMKLFDGSIYVYKLDKPFLKPEAVPTIFPNLPKYFSSKALKRKAPAFRNRRKQVSTYLQNEMLEPHPDPNEDDCRNLTSTYSLDVNDIEKPNEWWVVNKTDNGCILCVKLDADCHVERHVMVTKDYSVKIFLRNYEVKLEKEDKIQSAQNLSLLLKKVDKFVVYSHLEYCSSFSLPPKIVYQGELE